VKAGSAAPKDTRSKKKLRAAAFHEAGHAVEYYYQGRLGQVSIEAGRPSTERTAVLPRGTFKPFVETGGGASASSGSSDVIQDLVVRLAGPAAQENDLPRTAVTLFVSAPTAPHLKSAPKQRHNGMMADR